MVATSVAPLRAEKLTGGDISLLPVYENAKAQYLTSTGAPIADVIKWSHDEGMNAMRVRVFVNPALYKEKHKNETNADRKYDPNACQDLEYIIPICKRIKQAGMKLMLDIHYSDTWADPVKQWTPYDWVGLNEDQLVAKVEEYTSQTVKRLKDEGAAPDLVQVGNEISYGMLWGTPWTNAPLKCMNGSSTNWNRLGRLLKAGVKGVKDNCPDAKIILHNERISNLPVLKNFFEQMKTLSVNYDIVGLSYYSYFHGDIGALTNALAAVTSVVPDKEIMIVETGYSYKWEVPGTNSNYVFTNKWPYSPSGQDRFIKDVINAVASYPKVTGIFWWWMEYNAYPYSTTKLDGWYNAPLFDCETGKASPALTTLAKWAENSAVKDVVNTFPADDVYYDLAGRKVLNPTNGIYIKNGKKVLVK